MSPISGFLDYWNLKFGICLLENFGVLNFWFFGSLELWIFGSFELYAIRWGLGHLGANKNKYWHVYMPGPKFLCHERCSLGAWTPGGEKLYTGMVI